METRGLGLALGRQGSASGARRTLAHAVTGRGRVTACWGWLGGLTKRYGSIDSVEDYGVFANLPEGGTLGGSAVLDRRAAFPSVRHP